MHSKNHSSIHTNCTSVPIHNTLSLTPPHRSTMGAPQRRTIYIASLEAHIDRLHEHLDVSVPALSLLPSLTPNPASGSTPSHPKSSSIIEVSTQRRPRSALQPSPPHSTHLRSRASLLASNTMPPRQGSSCSSSNAPYVFFPLRLSFAPDLVFRTKVL